MHEHLQSLLDRIREDIASQDDPTAWERHPLAAEVLAHARSELTTALLEMLWHNPNWILVSTLQRLHGERGASCPVEESEHLHQVCGYWVTWGVRQGYLGPVDIDMDAPSDG